MKFKLYDRYMPFFSIQEERKNKNVVTVQGNEAEDDEEMEKDILQKTVNMRQKQLDKERAMAGGEAPGAEAPGGEFGGGAGGGGMFGGSPSFGAPAGGDFGGEGDFGDEFGNEEQPLGATDEFGAPQEGFAGEEEEEGFK